MPEPIKVLLVEDDAEDAELALRELRKGGYHAVSRRVETAAEMKDALREGDWDLILSDFSLPGFSGYDALQLLKASGRDIPFLIVSGTVGEETAVASLRAGAQDFILKGRLSRLVPSVERELSKTRDARARRSTERALRLSEERQALILASLPMALYTASEFGRTTWVSANVDAVTGFCAEAFCWESRDLWAQRLHVEDRGRVFEAYRELPRTGTFSVEYRWRCKDGEYRWFLDQAFAVLDEKGAFKELAGTWLDITKRKEQENRLQESNQTLRAVIEASPLAVVAVDVEGRVELWNPSAERMFGWPAAEALALIDKSVPESGKDAYRELTEQVLRGETLTELSARRVRRDGSVFDISLSAAPLREAGGRISGAIFLISDVTDRKKLEEQLKGVQKMEAIGRLAGGIAHDFNNILTGIIGYSEMLLGRLSKEDPLRSDVEEIRKSGARAADLTRQLLAFSRRQVVQPKALNLNSIVLDMERLLKRVIGEDVHLIHELDPALGAIVADPGQIGQVIMNLAVNARDAMPKGGELRILTGNADLGEGDPRLQGRPPGPYVVLEARDQGCGMSAEVRARIFEPFFTTKAPGQGTGLGLATVYGVVEQSKGWISVESSPGRGTALYLYFPRVPKTVEPKKSTDPKAQTVGGSETILMVEDQDEVRALARRILGAQGYKVIEASHPGEALAMVERYGGKIDLLLTDVVMPGMSGLELAELLAKKHHDLKILLMSGYGNEALEQVGVVNPSFQLIEKPFSPASLLSRIREFLGESSESAACALPNRLR